VEGAGGATFRHALVECRIKGEGGRGGREGRSREEEGEGEGGFGESQHQRRPERVTVDM